MARLADSFLFRARAVRLNWGEIGRRQAAALHEHQLRGAEGFPDPKRLRLRSMDIHLTWACATELGVPHGPFTVWIRKDAASKLREVEARTFFRPEGLGLSWGGVEAALVDVTCQVVDPSRPVAVFLYRTSPSLHDAVAAKAVLPGGAATVTFRIATSGATQAVVVNGSNPVLQIETLRDVVNAPEWRRVEIVGLPADQPWAGTNYDATDQGAVAAPTSPADAAISRLRRGGPPSGWWPVTESGHAAPAWSAPDPKVLVEEVRKDLLPRIRELYHASLREYRQATVSAQHVVAGPQQDGRTSSLETKIDLRPWSLLVLPALTDPFLNLASGFGSSYSVEPLDKEQIAVGNSDFLVTAHYANLRFPHTGPAELAAYAPAAEPHLSVPAPTGVVGGRDGLVPPPLPDLAWRETVRLSWDRLPVTAALGNVTESAVSRFEPAPGAVAESLLPVRDSGGRRPLVISPDGQQGQPGYDRVSVVDGGAEIPLGSGGRQIGYAVAVSDVFGVWSSWKDVPYIGDEPGPEPPRIVSLELTSTFAGSANCPASLAAQLSVEWVQRSPTSLEIVAVFFPMATATSAPPPGLSPTAPAPAGCFRRDLGLTFSGDTPTGVGCSVLSLDPNGEFAVAPGPGQGNGGRRYAIQADLPLLDFGSTPRWGVQLWTRRSLLVGDSPSGWSPDPAHPALASVGSPIPVQPLPPPAPPGVPLGSTIDAQGCSHVRVHWALPAGSDVRTVIVWEVAETALRQRCGLSSRAPDTDAPGVRLAALWAAYDALTGEARRNAFRRFQEVDGNLRELDVALPKGSTDIHLFAVTAVTSTGVESPWPSGPGAPHEHMQAVIAPRLPHPAPPLARSSVAADGVVTIELHAASSVPVTEFRLFRTRSETAARSVETMGPAFAEQVVSGAPATVDPLTNEPVYSATWSGAFPESWDAWLIRAVALPVDTVPVEGVRGLPSQASDVVSLFVPPSGPPDLAPLEYDIWGGDHRGVVVRSSTSAPARALPLGTHRFTASAGALTLTATPIEELPETALAAPPAAAGASAVLERGARASGRSPVALWFTRPVAADPVDVTLRLIDPLGRAVERTVTVPGWTPPPPVDLTIVDSFAVGRGVVFEVDCDAPVDVSPPYVMEIRAVQRPRRLGPVLPFRAMPDRAEPLWPVPGRSLETSIPFDQIPTAGLWFLPSGRIQVVRNRGHYAVWVPMTSPVSVLVSVVAPEGGRISVTGSA